METLKMNRSRVFLASIYFFLFIGIMMGLLMFLGMHPEIANRSSTISMKTGFLSGSDWGAYFDLLLQVVLTVVVIGSGIITSWDFGREFTDKVIKDLLVMPLPRGMIVVSKLIVLSGWSLMLSIIVLLAAIITGLFIQLPGWNTTAFCHFLQTYLICSLLNIFLITPVAFVASAGRGYILPISFVILIMILTQIIFLGIPSFSYWFPWALPALVSKVAGQAMPQAGFPSYLLYGMLVAGGLLGTVWWWKHADHH
jgi:ABC-2 type transport system permease protein